jgi:hypothetical protein
VILFSATHAAALRAYLEAPGGRWANHVIAASAGTTASVTRDGARAAVPRVRLLTSPGVSSVGDALRAVDGTGVVRSDPFLLVDGCVVSNMQLGAAVAAHAARAKADNNAILTVVLRPAAGAAASAPGLPPRHPSAQPAGEAVAITMSTAPDDGRIVAYVSSTASASGGRPSTCQDGAAGAPVQHRMPACCGSLHLPTPARVFDAPLPCRTC